MTYHYSQEAQKNGGQQEIQRNEDHFTENILTTIVPTWRSYAKKTGSSLFVEEIQGGVELMLTNSKRFDIGEEDIGIKLALGVATHIGIDMTENELQMCVSYSMEHFR